MTSYDIEGAYRLVWVGIDGGFYSLYEGERATPHPPMLTASCHLPGGQRSPLWDLHFSPAEHCLCGLYAAEHVDGLIAHAHSMVYRPYPLSPIPPMPGAVAGVVRVNLYDAIKPPARQGEHPATWRGAALEYVGPLRSPRLPRGTAKAVGARYGIECEPYGVTVDLILRGLRGVEVRTS